jgi:hypothetical protein
MRDTTPPKLRSTASESETGWSPYLSLDDAQKLDEVREALRASDLKKASRLARVFQLTPLDVH